METVTHWSENRSWNDALESYHDERERGLKKIEIDLDAVEKIIFNGEGPAYELMDAMVSVQQLEGMDGYKGAPRLILALLMRLHELSDCSKKP